MKKSDSKLRNLNRINPIFLIIIGILVFLGGFFIGQVDTKNKQETDYVLTGDIKGEYNEVDVSILWEVWQKLESNYLEKSLDGEGLINGAVNGLVESLDDPYTNYLTKEETEEYLQQNSGEFEGIGTTLRYNGDYTEIETPIDGYPASEVGLRPGDLILKVDGKDVQGKNAYEVADLIKGEAGTKVVLEVVREGRSDVLEFEITRVNVDLKSINFEKKSDKTAYIKITQFTEDSLSEFHRQWDEAAKQVISMDPNTVVVDLRNNPGGYVEGVNYVLSDFFEKGTLVMSERDRNGNTLDTVTNREGKLKDYRLIVLVNEGSASASEIFAGAIQDNQRGTIIGMSTVGKGVEQRILQLSNGGSLHVVFQEWVLPSGRTISSEDPITPDIKVELTEEDFEQKKDPQLDKALELSI